MVGKLALGSAAGGALLLLTQMGAAAATDPYSAHQVGYDYSYPQCSARSLPGGQFAVVGINGGYPFTYYNPCLSTEYANALKTANASLYINTGYDPSYTAVDGVHTTSDCAAKSSSSSGDAAHQAAWAVGCSEAERDVQFASGEVSTAKAWWLDVETANSWSTSDLTLNQSTLDGIVATLRTLVAAPIGVYSTAAQWRSITGGYDAHVDAEWLATGQRTLKRAQQSCTATRFTGSAPIWLVQYVATVDGDYAC